MKPNRLVILILGGVLGGGSGLAWAQTITLSPSLTVSEEYDDNVLLSPGDRESDFVTSVRPELRLTIIDHPWTVTGAASVRGVYYARRPDLNTSSDNREGNLTIEFRPTPRFTASLTDNFIRNLDPGEVDPETGIITGRFASSRNTLTPAISYQINPRTHIRTQYSFSTLRSDSVLAKESNTHALGFFVQREFTPRTSGTLQYTYNRFQPEGTPDRNAHSPRIGLAHAFSPNIRVSADAGPLILERSDGATRVTVSGSLRYEQDFGRGRYSLAYDRSARVAGVIGEAATIQSLTATASFRVTRNVTMGVESEVRATELETTAENFLVYRAGIRLEYRILQWLSVNGGYRYFHQDDRADRLDLDRNIIFIGFTASTELRVY